MKRYALGLGLAIGMAAVAGAQEMPKPAAEMSQLAFFQGSWTCEGKMHETPVSPAGTMTGTANIQADLGGFFQTGKITGHAAGMPPYEGIFHTTWDPMAKQFVMYWFDNMGGWSRATSAGWKGDAMVYMGEGQMGGMPMKGRDTFTKMGANGMRHVWEAEMNGTWITMGEETCRK